MHDVYFLLVHQFVEVGVDIYKANAPHKIIFTNHSMNDKVRLNATRFNTLTCLLISVVQFPQLPIDYTNDRVYI